MSAEHLAAVFRHSNIGGSHLVILLTVANYSDQRGEWLVDQATLQKRAHLGRRRVQQILDDLVESGDLAVTSRQGRGQFCTYRIQVGEKAQPSAPFAEAAEAPARALQLEKGEAQCAVSLGKGEAECAFSAPKGAAQCAFPAPPCPPFPPDPQFPLYPPELKPETFGLRPLSGPQSAVFRVNRLLEEAAIPLPSPAQIGLWTKTLGGIEPLLALLSRLIQAGLANKHTPLVYAHRAVIEHAAHPDPAPQASSSSARPLRAGRSINPLHFAGSDEARRRQAERIMAATRPAPRGTT